MQITNNTEYQQALTELTELGDIPIDLDTFNALYGARFEELVAAVTCWEARNN